MFLLFLICTSMFFSFMCGVFIVKKQAQRAIFCGTMSAILSGIFIWVAMMAVMSWFE